MWNKKSHKEAQTEALQNKNSSENQTSTKKLSNTA